jgi:uncharacterized protein YutE (UPF0331/DUF86 family)
MTFLIERLVLLDRHLGHLRTLRPRVRDAKQLEGDLSLQNDVLHSLQAICQLVIDIAGELSTRRGLKFEDYTGAVRNLSAYPEFPPDVVTELARLPSFRNVLIRQYLEFDLSRAVEALGRLDIVERFMQIVRRIDSRS